YENSYRFAIPESDPGTVVNRSDLAALGGAEIVALRIPEAGKLRKEWERQVPGRTRIAGLFLAIAAVRRQLDRYLTERSQPTADQLIRSLSVPPEILQDADPSAIAALRLTTDTLNRYAGIVMLPFTDGGREF